MKFSSSAGAGKGLVAVFKELRLPHGVDAERDAILGMIKEALSEARRRRAT